VGTIENGDGQALLTLAGRRQLAAEEKSWAALTCAVVHVLRTV
jgi:hypothetical protein